MTVTVRAATSDASTTDTSAAPGPVPAAPGSPLIDLRARREARRAAQHLDLEVPGWHSADFPYRVWIRYRPPRVSVALRSSETRTKQSPERRGGVDPAVLSTLDVLVDACVGVYLSRDDGARFTLLPDGTWGEFDPDTAGDADWATPTGDSGPRLAAAFGAPDATTAVDVLWLGLFDGHEPHLFGHDAQLSAWAAGASEKADREAVGE